jgi:hypothetical protein
MKTKHQKQSLEVYKPRAKRFWMPEEKMEKPAMPAVT